MYLRPMTASEVKQWYDRELTRAFPPDECKPLSEIAALMERGRYEALGLYAEDALLGYGEVRAILDEGTLEKIAVAPAYRRQGVAEAILSAFLRFGQAHLAFLTLEVRETNAPAIALYEKLGFEPVGRRKNYYRQLHEDALLMTRTFRPAG